MSVTLNERYQIVLVLTAVLTALVVVVLALTNGAMRRAGRAKERRILPGG